MKCFVFVALVIVSIVALEAKPFGLGLGRMGWGGMGSQFANGGGFGGQRYDSGNSGFGNQGYDTSGANEFHNIGGHHDRRLSINDQENSGFHNIGGGSAIHNGGFSDGAFNNYMNGGSGYGNEYNSGSDGMMM